MDWTQEEDTFLRENYIKIEWPPIKIAKQLGRTRISILNRAQKFSLLRNGPKNFKSFMTKETLTKREAYVLGFLWADGGMLRTGANHAIKLEIKKEDANILSDLFPEWYKYQRPAKRETWSPTTIFQTSNLAFFEFLESFDYTDKIDCSKILQYVPEEFHHFWWRGYADGDGGFYTGGNYIRQWTISGPYETNWSVIEELFQKLGMTNIRNMKYISIKGYKSSRIDIRGVENLRKLGDYLYGLEWDQLGLYRKYTKYQECLFTGKEWRNRA